MLRRRTRTNDEVGLIRPPFWNARRTRWLDIGLVVALLLPLVVMTAEGQSTVGLAFSAAQILPLLIRRRHPVLAFGLVAIAVLMHAGNPEPVGYGQVAGPVALYSVAAFSDRLHARAGLATALVIALVNPIEAYPMFAVVLIAAWALGTLARTRRAYVAALIDRGERLEREAAQQAELAAAAERARIAREMHDVVAHGLSVMIVQADGARYAVNRDPSAAGAALETIASTGRESLAEMRRMLGLLRSDDTGSGVTPQPGLSQLEPLLHQSRLAGMALTAQLPDPMPATSTGVGLTAYRIVQEALTNVRKHAGPGAEVRVCVSHRPDDTGARELVVEVTDDGQGAGAAGDGDGHGLAGMRERIAVHGGRFEAGPGRDGGFGVRACIPLTEPSPPAAQSVPAAQSLPVAQAPFAAELPPAAQVETA